MGHDKQNHQEGDLTAACFEPAKTFLVAAVTKDGITPELVSEARDLAALSNISMMLMRGLGKTWTPAMRMIGGSTPYRLQEVFAREVGHIATAERRWQQAARRAEEKGEKAPPRPAAKPR